MILRLAYLKGHAQATGGIYACINRYACANEPRSLFVDFRWGKLIYDLIEYPCACNTYAATRQLRGF